MIVPLLWPISSPDSGQIVSSIPLRKGDEVIVSITNANTNEMIWGEDGREWKPERWFGKTPNNVGNVPLAGAYSSM